MVTTYHTPFYTSSTCSTSSLQQWRENSGRGNNDHWLIQLLQLRQLICHDGEFYPCAIYSIRIDIFILNEWYVLLRTNSTRIHFAYWKHFKCTNLMLWHHDQAFRKQKTTEDIWIWINNVSLTEKFTWSSAFGRVKIETANFLLHKT